MRVKQEKDFFFNKLRNIELLCSADEAPLTKKKDFVEKILAELYSSDVSIYYQSDKLMIAKNLSDMYKKKQYSKT